MIIFLLVGHQPDLFPIDSLLLGRDEIRYGGTSQVDMGSNSRPSWANFSSCDNTVPFSIGSLLSSGDIGH